MTKPQGPKLVNAKASPALVALAITALTFAFYLALNAQAGFVFDDRPNIAGNPAVTSFVPDSLEAWRRAAFDSPARLRPLSNLTLAWQWHLWRDAPLPYHAAGDLFHALAAGALFWLLLELLRAAGPSAWDERKRTLLAAAGALLWALHPANSQAVHYVVQRMSVLAGLFSFLSLALYVRGRRERSWKPYPLAALCYLLALASKESAATLPVITLLYEWTLAPTEERRARAVRLTLLALALVPPVLMALAYARMSPMHFAWGRLPGRDYTLLDRVISGPRMYWRYLALLAVPYPLALDYGLKVSRSLTEPWTTLPAILAIFLLATGAVAIRGRRPALCLAVLAFLALLGPETTFLNLELFYEHRLYVASAALLALVPLALARFLDKKERTWKPGAVAIGALLLVLATLTALRAQDWQTPVRLLESNARARPENARVHYNLGQELVREGRLAQALISYRRADERGYPEAAFAIGSVLQKMGRTREAKAAYHRALKDHPRPSEVWVNLGLIAKQEGDLERAEQDYLKAIRANPANAQAFSNLGNLLLGQRRFKEARQYLDLAVDADPALAEAYYNRMLLGIAQGKMIAAFGDYERARALAFEPAEKYDTLFEPFTRTRWERENERRRFTDPRAFQVLPKKE